MRRFIFVAIFSFWVLPAFAQTAVLDNFRGANKNSVEVSATNPMPVTGSFSASSFTATSTGTPISVTSSGVSGTLPAGSVVVATNVGTTNGAYCALGASATTASQYIAPNGGWFAFAVGVSTQLTCITATSTTTVNMTGGSGLPTGAGGGGGSSGSSGAVFGPTAAGSAAANPPVLMGGTVDGTATGNVDNWKVSAGIGYIDTGTTGNLQTALAAPPNLLVNGSNVAWSGLAPGTAQTGTIVAANVDHTSTGGVAMGVMANYGTSPGAVKVEGVNAFVTNTITAGLNTTPTIANGNGVVPTQGGAVLSATNGWYGNILQGNVVLSATNGIYANALQGNVVLSATNPSFAALADGTNGPAAIKAASTPSPATDKSLSVTINAGSNGLITLGPATIANSVPVIPSSQYPGNATAAAVPVTATATGTTAATVATIPAVSGKTAFICGFTITADATALAVGTAVVSGTISGSLSYLQGISAVTSGAGNLTQSFNPCVPASAANTAIVVTSAAAGTGGNTIVNAQGYYL